MKTPCVCVHMCSCVRLIFAAAASDLNLSLLRVTVKHWEHLVLSSTHKILSHPWVSCWNAVNFLPEMCSQRVSEKRHSSFACHKTGRGSVREIRTSQCPYWKQVTNKTCWIKKVFVVRHSTPQNTGEQIPHAKANFCLFDLYIGCDLKQLSCLIK